MIIIKGRARADGGQLAAYLLSQGGDNTSIGVLEMRGLAGRDLRAGLRLAETEAELSRGTKPLWHAQIAPADGVTLTREQQIAAADTLERHLGFQGLPRVIVEHVKDGQPHTHVVWSRFDRETNTLRRDDFSKHKNVNAAAEVAQRLGLEPNRNPFQSQQEERQDLTREERRERTGQADTHAERQQDKRSHKTRQQRRVEISALWESTDSGQALRAALDEAGYTLARGWRGFVVVDEKGQAHSLARQIDGARAKDVRERLADLDPGSILSAKEIKAAMRQAQADRLRETTGAAVATQPARQVQTEDTATAAAPPLRAQHKLDPAPEAPISEGIRVAADPSEAIQRPSHEAENRKAEPETPENRTPHGTAADPIGTAEAGTDARADAAAKPKTAEDILAALTRNHSTFTRQDLSRLVSKETRGTGNEPWMMKAGGLDALDDDARASAEKSYASWAEDNPDSARRFGLARYVAYVQDKQAERDAADPEALEKRRQAQAAFASMMGAVEALPDLIRLGPDHIGRERLTSRSMLETELRMEAAADHLAERTGHAVPGHIREAVPGLDKLGDQQRAAFDHITDAGDIALVVGFAGTGKSFALGLGREAWEAAGLRVRGAALSGIAADSLEEGAGIRSRTLHSLLHQLDTIGEREAALADVDQKLAALREADGPLSGHRRGNRREQSYLATKRDGMAADLEAVRLTDRDVIVLDEAGMVDSALMGRLLTAADQAGAKVVLVGDHEQLQAVGAGAAFRALREEHGAVDITEVRRQREAWQREATGEFGRTETKEALGRYHDAGMTHQAPTREKAKVDLVEGWTAARAAKADDTHIILAYTRADVAELNEIARTAYRAEGRLGEDKTLETATGDKAFATGDRLYFTKNDTRLAVKNGSLGTIEAIEGERVTVKLDTGRAVEFDTRDYDSIAHGYAATVHKSQGVTVDRAHVMASRYMDRHAAYVGMTRHRDRADLYYGADEFKTFDSLARRMSRDGSKDTTLDYLARAAEGQASASLREAVGAFYERERPDMPRPTWTQPPPTPEAPRPAERFMTWGEMLRAVATPTPDAAPAPASPIDERAAWAQRLRSLDDAPQRPTAAAQRPAQDTAPEPPCAAPAARPTAPADQRKTPAPEATRPTASAAEPQREKTAAEVMREREMANGGDNSGDVYKRDDRLAAWREKMTPKERAAFDAARKQAEAAETLRQELAQRQDLNGPRL